MINWKHHETQVRLRSTISVWQSDCKTFIIACVHLDNRDIPARFYGGNLKTGNYKGYPTFKECERFLEKPFDIFKTV